MHLHRSVWPLSYTTYFAAIVTFFISATLSADNLLSNSDFSAGEPKKDFFGWTLETATEHQGECSVVEGRLGNSRALRFYNDERSSSFISQEINVQPWRKHGCKATACTVPTCVCICKVVAGEGSGSITRIIFTVRYPDGASYVHLTMREIMRS